MTAGRARRVRPLMVVVLAALCAACASTAQRRPATGALPPSDPRVAPSGARSVSGDSGTATGAADATGVADGDASGAVSDGSTISGATAPGDAPDPTQTVATAPDGQPGSIRIGIHVSKDLQAAYAAFGAKGAEGDITPGLRKVVDWINANGGMGGHRVEPVFHASDPLNGSFDAEGQATCDDFADDKHVFAVVSGAVLPTIVTVDCLVKKHVPIVWNYHYLVDGPMWHQYLPYLYMPFSVSADRLGFVVDQLAATRYFDVGTRLAVVRYDLPQHARLVSNVLRQRLSAHGIDIAEEVAIRPPDSAAAAADTGAQISSAILRLRAARINHVLFVPTGGAVPFVFMSEAEGQGFRPRYALTTLDIPSFVNDQAPASQLHGALAVGWSPPSDVNREEAPPANEATARCYQLTNSQTSQRFCDGLFFLKTALDRAPTIDAAGLRAAVEAMGDAFEPTFSLATHFGPGRHDGASATRVAAYDDGCSCFRYTGPVTPIG